MLASIGMLVGVISMSAGAQESGAPGVSKKTIKLGFIYTASGPGAASFKDGGKACQARVAAENARGGVNGRKIDLQLVDDGSAGGNLTAAHDLVENDKAFAVINDSGGAFLSYRYLLGQGVPLVGGGYDGTYYGQKGNEDIISALGNTTALNGLTYDTAARMIKRLGGTKTATAGYSASPSSAASAQAFQDYAARALGLKPVYTNTAVDYLNSDPGPIVLGMKNAGADSAYLPLADASNIAIAQLLLQNNVNMKATIMATGYGQSLLDSPVAKMLSPTTIFTQSFKPVELQDTATKRFQADLRKYAGLTGVPGFDAYLGYISCDLTIQGLKGAGANPTRQGFIDAVRKMETYDQAGLACQPVDIGLDTFGKPTPTQCGYFMAVKNGKFVVLNQGKPLVGNLVGAPDLLKAARSGAATTTTATTLAP
jgi:branched-chain amino acid transport system substrate-binding protein